MTVQQSNMHLANERNYLWPTVADALDTYLRRKANNVGNYERIWRLIHVWESICVTLAAAAISRVRFISTADNVFRRCRECCYGRSWNEIDKTFAVRPGALDGSMNEWIDVLWEISKHEWPDSVFLRSLAEFLNASQLKLRPLLQEWHRACDIPQTPDGEALSVKQAMRFVNVFRNRFAHVPFPHDPVGGIAEELERLTEFLFSIEPVPIKVTAQVNSPLTGGLAKGQVVLRGSLHCVDAERREQLRFVFPSDRRDGSEPEEWDSVPFAHLDEMLRPYVLTRLKDRSIGTWEYTRFRAEANPIVARDSPSDLRYLPEPKPSEYQTEEEQEIAEEVLDRVIPPVDQLQPAAPTIPASFPEAIAAIRNEDFDGAIEFFRNLTETRPGYHIGWLRLGYAKREKAVRLRDAGDVEGALGLLNEAVENLKKAGGHQDTEYKAAAYYEVSKALFQRGRTTAEKEDDIRPAYHDYITAYEEAERACKFSSDAKHASWLDYLKRILDVEGRNAADS